MNRLSWKGGISGFKNVLPRTADVNLASGWDEYPEDGTERMEILEMGFYRTEHAQSNFDWSKFQKLTTKAYRDKYGRRIIDPEKEDIQWPPQEKP